MKLDKPFTPMLNNLALFSASILPAKLVESPEAAFFEHPIGSGPFVLKHWNRGEAHRSDAQPALLAGGQAACRRRRADRGLAEDNAAVLKLQAGELDAIIGVPFNQVEDAQC